MRTQLQCQALPLLILILGFPFTDRDSDFFPNLKMVAFIGASITTGISGNNFPELISSYVAPLSLERHFRRIQKPCSTFQMFDSSPASRLYNVTLLGLLSVMHYSFSETHKQIEYCRKYGVPEIIIAVDVFFWPVFNPDWTADLESADQANFRIDQLQQLIACLDSYDKHNYVVSLLPRKAVYLPVFFSTWNYIPGASVIQQANAMIRHWVNIRNQQQGKGRVLLVDFSDFYTTSAFNCGPPLGRLHIRDLMSFDGIHPKPLGIFCLTTRLVHEMKEWRAPPFSELSDELDPWLLPGLYIDGLAFPEQKE